MKMSKRKDRMNTNFRCCPMCGGKQIIVYITKKRFKEKTFIYCYKCQKNIDVKVVYRKENLDSLEIRRYIV